MPFIARKTLSETFLERLKTTPKAPAFQYKDGEWRTITYGEFHKECRLVSFGLMGLGIQPGDRVAILSNTRYEWALCDMAILGAKGVTVPIYASNTASDAAYILNDSGARVVIVESAMQLEKLAEKRGELKTVEKIVVMESAGMQSAAAKPDTLSLQALRELGRREETTKTEAFEKNLMSARPDEWVTICYTSGTTGIPKGAILTQDNFASVMEDASVVIGREIKPEAEVIVSFLPYSHIFGKVEHVLGYTFGWKVAYAENLDRLVANLAEIRPTVIFAVPRIFEKAYTRIQNMLLEGSGVKQKLFDWALAVGRRYHSALWENRRPSAADLAQYLIADRLVFSKIQARFGGRMKFAVSGGAPLPREIGEFFEIAGLQLLEGYGLTETTGPTNVNLPGASKLGTVGRPLPDVSIKIAEDGEILIKSRKIFAGYFNKPEATKNVHRDGWYYTGDIGYIDKEGYLKITDRKKDIIVTSGGKNVAPQKIENLAKSQKFVNQFVVHGDRRPYLSALLTLDKDQVIQYANEHQILFSAYSELVKHPKIQGLIQKRVIDPINQQLASYETVKKFIILDEEFTVEKGEITPSLKIRRGIIEKKYQAELDRMYEA